jgi:hypothetical protein
MIAGSLRESTKNKQDTKCLEWQYIILPPVFVIHLKHIDERVKVQLAKEDEETRNEILKQVAERIFETVDKRFFLLSGLPFLNVKCEK